MASGEVSGATVPPTLAALATTLKTEPAAAAAVLLAQCDVDTLDLAGLERAERFLDRVKAFTAANDVKLARRRRELAEQGHAAPVDRSHRGRLSGREQRAAAGREDVCERLPVVEDALASGKIATGHIDAIANATARLSDDEKSRFDEHAESLVDQATAESVDDFAKTCQNVARAAQADEGEAKLNDQRANNKISRRIDDRTGMHHIHAELDPETGTKVWHALRSTFRSMKHHHADTATEAPAEPVDFVDDGAQPDRDELRLRVVTAAHDALAVHAAQAASYDQLMVQAFVESITGARAVDRRIPEICVHIDFPTITDGLHPDSVCETADGVPLPPETIRRMCCDGGILPAVLGGESEVLDLGRSRRLASPGQRTALRAMYAMCVIPGCTAAWDRLEVHHVDEWTGQVGETNLNRLVPICPHDHHRIHEGGWTLALERDSARTITLARPDGTTEYHGPSINRPPRRNVA